MRLPAFADGDVTRRFNAGLYLEHVEEAAFLHEQILGFYDDPQVGWLDSDDFEKRLEAHLDALLSGEGPAIEICQQRAQQGEPGELYAAMCVFCRAGRRDLLSGILKGLDPDNAARLQAVSDAMKDEMPAEWAQALATGLAHGHEILIPIFAHYVGYRRLAVGDALSKLFDRAPAKGLAQVLWGMDRAGGDAIASHAAGYVDHEDAAVRASAVIALLRRGDTRALAACRAGALRGDPAMLLPLAASGGRSEAASLRNLVLTKASNPDALIALGLLGDLGSLEILVDRLTDKSEAAAAATALQLITGAALTEEAFIPEVVDEGELFEDELLAYRESGEGPKHADDRPFGINVERTSQDPDDWRDWLEKHKSQFDPMQRYRLGKPFSLATLVDTLVSPSFTRQVRSLAYEELVIRYGIDIAFETEMRVDEQKKQINAIARLCRSSEASFRSGHWYFAGR